jgi:hypothetical protein
VRRYAAMDVLVLIDGARGPQHDTCDSGKDPMSSSRIHDRVDRLLDEIEAAWSNGRWTAVITLAQEVLDLEPQSADAAAYLEAAKRRGRREVGDVARSLDCYPVLAFLTDRLNRIQWVNRVFAEAIGDPLRDHIPPEERFVPAAIAGPYRERFPRWKEEISRRLSGLHQEVSAGNLAAGTLRLIDQTLSADSELSSAAMEERPWDGTMVIRDKNRRLSMVRERVLTLVDDAGLPTGFHASLWFPSDADPSCPQRRKRSPAPPDAPSTPDRAALRLRHDRGRCGCCGIYLLAHGPRPP